MQEYTSNSNYDLRQRRLDGLFSYSERNVQSGCRPQNFCNSVFSNFNAGGNSKSKAEKNMEKLTTIMTGISVASAAVNLSASIYSLASTIKKDKKQNTPTTPDPAPAGTEEQNDALKDAVKNLKRASAEERPLCIAQLQREISDSRGMVRTNETRIGEATTTIENSIQTINDSNAAIIEKGTAIATCETTIADLKTSIRDLSVVPADETPEAKTIREGRLNQAKENLPIKDAELLQLKADMDAAISRKTEAERQKTQAENTKQTLTADNIRLNQKINDAQAVLARYSTQETRNLDAES